MSDSFGLRLIKGLLSRKFPNVDNVSTQTVHRWKFERNEAESSRGQDDPGRVVILDARGAEEYKVSHIVDAINVHPGAQPLDVEKTLSHLKEHQQDGKQSVVCYCSVGYRGSTYANALNELLRKENPELLKSISVYNLEGGLFKWANEGRPMIDYKNRATVKAHPHFAMVGKLLLNRNLMTFHPDP